MVLFLNTDLFFFTSYSTLEVQNVHRFLRVDVQPGVSLQKKKKWLLLSTVWVVCALFMLHCVVLLFPIMNHSATAIASVINLGLYSWLRASKISLNKGQIYVQIWQHIS